LKNGIEGYMKNNNIILINEKKVQSIINSDNACRIAFSTQKAKESALNEIIKEMESSHSTKLPGKILEKKLKEKARKILSESEEIESKEKIKDSLLSSLSNSNSNSRTKVLFKEIKRIYRIVDEDFCPFNSSWEENDKYLNPDKQKVLTKPMMQECINDLLNIEFKIQVYRKLLEKESEITAQHESLSSDFYPTLFNVKEGYFDEIWDKEDEDSDGKEEE
jgi:hypothetical protein